MSQGLCRRENKDSLCHHTHKVCVGLGDCTTMLKVHVGEKTKTQPVTPCSQGWCQKTTATTTKTVTPCSQLCEERKPTENKNKTQPVPPCSHGQCD